MCGRFTLQVAPELTAEIFGLPDIPALPARYNIAPSQQVAVIRRNNDGQNRLEMLRWGLIPSWAKDKTMGNSMINARAETVAEKPAFRSAIKYRRCLVLASGFYEWKEEGGRKASYIVLRDGSPMVFAGLWESWKSPEGEVTESCAILTTSSNKLMESLHERMPVILHREEFALWLDRAVVDPELLAHLYQPYPADMMAMYPVSQQVNSPNNDSPELIKPRDDSNSATGAVAS